MKIEILSVCNAEPYKPAIWDPVGNPILCVAPAV